jgi:pyridoxal phosphate enzyme (YggS family)
LSPDLQNDFFSRLTQVKSILKDRSQLVIVSKNRTAEEIKSYYDLGQRDFGENKVQELHDKSLKLLENCPDIRWHMIGHLQSNKINQLFSIPKLWAIHSVDSIELLIKMIHAESRLLSHVNIFLQLKTSKEVEKYGFESLQDLDLAILEIQKSQRLKIYGLMTMGVVRTDQFEQEARRCFQDLNRIKEILSNKYKLSLNSSMGMSQDYLIALEENSNWIRLGTMMFE